MPRLPPIRSLETTRGRAPTPIIGLAVLLWGLAISCGGGAPTGIQAGASVADITPRSWPLPQIGSFRYRPASGAHDPLHARALVLRRSESTVAIALVDSCYIPRQTVEEAKQLVQEAIGLEPERILVAATHTHSAPPPAVGVGLRGLEPEATEENERLYSELLVRGIASAIVGGFENLTPAEVGWATDILADEVFNRRWHMKDGTIPPDPFGETTDRVRMNPPFASPDLVRPSGPVDPEVVILSVRTTAGKPIALLANYSLHYVGGIPEGLVSGDYFGEFARIVESRLDPDEGPVAILSNGTSGNINNLDFSRPRTRREPFEQVRRVAAKLADVVMKAYDGIDHVQEAYVGAAQSELVLDRRKPAPRILAQSRDLLADPPRSATARQLIYARRAVDLHEGPDRVSVALQAFRIGGLGIASLPFETFVETGLAIKEHSPLRPTFTISLANGAEGYLPTPEHHELGGYETWLGTSRVEEQSSVAIEKELLSLLGQVTR